jgi:pyridoxal phosphate enzyme (YggS family)
MSDHWMDLNFKIGANLDRLEARIRGAAGRSGRTPDEIRLVAVTKGRSEDAVRAAYRLGLRDFGENRAHEALEKIDHLSDLAGIRWHMIGHIQSRKARDVAPYFHLIHSVDRPKIAARLNRYGAELDRSIPVLLQCNMSGEDTKGGWDLWDRRRWRGIEAEFRQVSASEHLAVHGLMTMAPLTEDEGRIRDCFRNLRKLRDYLQTRVPGDWSQLSMGMSNDFEIAIEEGATLLRVGTAIFGPIGIGPT